MQALVFADRRGKELDLLCRQTPPALLPVLNRPLIEHTIEDLANAGINEILLVISDQSHLIEQALGSGRRWGVTIRYLLSRGEESPDLIVARFASLLKPPFLALRGDVFRSGTCNGLLAETTDTEDEPQRAVINGQDALLALITVWPTTIDFLGWNASPKLPASPTHLTEGLVCRLDRAADLHSINLQQLDLLDKDPAGETLGSDVLLRAPHTSVDPRSLINGRALVGRNAHVHHSARLSGNCIIGFDCHIDRDAEIINSVVLPGTYVGEGLQVENAIVGHDQLIRIDRNTAVSINDPQLFADNRTDMTRLLAQMPDQLLATLLLVMSAPLWPLALLLSLWHQPRRPLVEEQLRQTSSFRRVDGQTTAGIWGYGFATPVPLLRNLPLLLAVINGRIRLFGANYQSGITEITAITPHPYQDLAQGLLGPAQLYAKPPFGADAMRLAEVEFCAQRGPLALLKRLLLAVSGLFRARNWLAETRQSEMTSHV